MSAVQPDRPLRVMQVIQELTYGGAERIVATLSSRLDEKGAHV